MKIIEVMRVDDYHLEILIKGLKQYKDEGVDDPWILSDGTEINPLDILMELNELRKQNTEGEK